MRTWTAEFRFIHSAANIILPASPENAVKQKDVIAQVVENGCLNVAYKGVDINIECKCSFKNYSASSGLMMTASIGVLNEAFETVSKNGYENSAPLTFSPQLPMSIRLATSTFQMEETAKLFRNLRLHFGAKMYICMYECRVMTKIL